MGPKYASTLVNQRGHSFSTFSKYSEKQYFKRQIEGHNDITQRRCVVHREICKIWTSKVHSSNMNIKPYLLSPSTTD